MLQDELLYTARYSTTSQPANQSARFRKGKTAVIAIRPVNDRKTRSNVSVFVEFFKVAGKCIDKALLKLPWLTQFVCEVFGR